MPGLGVPVGFAQGDEGGGRARRIGRRDALARLDGCFLRVQRRDLVQFPGLLGCRPRAGQRTEVTLIQDRHVLIVRCLGVAGIGGAVAFVELGQVRIGGNRSRVGHAWRRRGRGVVPFDEERVGMIPMSVIPSPTLWFSPMDNGD